MCSKEDHPVLWNRYCTSCEEFDVRFGITTGIGSIHHICKDIIMISLSEPRDKLLAQVLVFNWHCRMCCNTGTCVLNGGHVIPKNIFPRGHVFLGYYCPGDNLSRGTKYPAPAVGSYRHFSLAQRTLNVFHCKFWILTCANSASIFPLIWMLLNRYDSIHEVLKCHFSCCIRSASTWCHGSIPWIFLFVLPSYSSLKIRWKWKGKRKHFREDVIKPHNDNYNNTIQYKT